MRRLSGKITLVTGGSRGIGFGIAKAVAREGGSVTIAARDTDTLKKAEHEIRSLGAEVLSVPTDVKDERQVDCLFDKHMDKFGKLDLLYNNAGVFNDKCSFGELSTEDWDHVIGINLRGSFLCGRAAFRVMKEQGGGRIVNLGSTSSQRPRRDNAPYSVSKFGGRGLTQSMAIDGRPHDIVVSCLHAGNVYTERRNSISDVSNIEPMMSVNEVVEVAILMGSFPLHVNLLEATVLPARQPYLERA
jgi:NAD(P)-dependent dehydrogenase (short-subunit alcohol dehydrogenase family)